MAKVIGIVVLAVLYLAVAYFAGPLWPMAATEAAFMFVFALLFDVPRWIAIAVAFVVDAAIKHGVYFVLMVAGWTAWVCLCALLYTVAERLIAEFRHWLRPSG
jgi:hypothetical protein